MYDGFLSKIGIQGDQWKGLFETGLKYYSFIQGVHNICMLEIISIRYKLYDQKAVKDMLETD